MAFVRPKNRVLERTTTAGTGPYTVTGAADASYRPFSSAMSIGDTTNAVVVEPGVAFWAGIVTYSALNQITLTTVSESNNSFGAGTKEIFMDTPAARDVYRDGNQTIDGALVLNGALTVTGAVTATFAGSHSFGPAGTGTGVSIVLEGSSGTNQGSSVIFKRNSVLLFGVGNSSGVAGGVSDDWILYSYTAALAVITSNATTGALTFGNVTATFGSTIIATASSTSRSGLRITAGTAPTSPVDGDAWNDSTDLKVRVGGVTHTPTKAMTVQRVLSGSGTYTTPAGCTWIRIRLVGGGGGGGGGNNSVASTAGTASTFSGGTLTASGGGSSSAVAGPSSGGGASGGNIANISGGGGGASSGVANGMAGAGGNSFFGGGGGGAASATTAGGAGASNTGGGGGGGAGGSTTSVPGGGGAGGYVEHFIAAPAATYTYVVGGGGAGAAGTSAGNGGAGATGILIVEEYYN